MKWLGTGQLAFSSVGGKTGQLIQYLLVFWETMEAVLGAEIILFVTTTKISYRNYAEEEQFVSIHGFRGFKPWLSGPCTRAGHHSGRRTGKE